MKGFLKVLSLMLVGIMMTGLLAACGKNSSSDSSGNSPDSSNASGSERAKKEAVTIKIFLDSAKSKNKVFSDIISEYNALGGDQVEMNVLPGDGVAAVQKMNILLSSGDSTDVVILDNPIT